MVGHNNQVMPTVSLFVGGRVGVVVYTNDTDLEERLACYPNVEVRRVGNDYAGCPPDLPDSPYFICVDKENLARQIKGWLPRTLAIFHARHESRGKTSAPGFLSLGEPQSQLRRNLMRRLSTLRRVDNLLSMARGAEMPLILMYADPDPDAIGAAYGLATIWRTIGIEPLIRYTGDVQRYQNKLMLSYLKEPIERLRDHEREAADLVAVVDAQPGFWKDAPPAADIVIDHHPRREDTVAAYVDVRDDYGSTATMLIEYLTEAGIPIRRKLATALLYGLMTDTADLTRDAASPDVKAYDAVHELADQHFLSRLKKSVVPMNMLDHIGWGISHRVVVRDLMLVHFGEIDNPDLLVQCADFMLLTRGINWVVCAGKVGGKLVVTFRGDGHRQDVGSRARTAFAKLGSAGGHRTMGRAEIELGGEHVDATIDLLVENLFKRMGPKRRRSVIRSLRNHLHGQGPAMPVEVA